MAEETNIKKGYDKKHIKINARDVMEVKYVKPVKHSVAFVIHNDDRSRFLVVLRPADEDGLTGVWGLPAGTLRDGETAEDAIKRSAQEKLGVSVRIKGLVARGEQERENYVLCMREYEAEIIEGVPAVPQRVQGITQYVRWKWGTVENLTEAARMGSLCCKLYMNASGLGKE